MIGPNLNPTPTMIKIDAIACTGYPVTNVARARAFYEGVLGLKPSTIFGEQDGAAWIEYDIGPGTLAIASVGADKWKPSSDGPALAFEVADFDGAIAHLQSHGVHFALEPVEFPSCRMACVHDPDGNQLTIHQRKTPA